MFPVLARAIRIVGLEADGGRGVIVEDNTLSQVSSELNSATASERPGRGLQ